MNSYRPSTGLGGLLWQEIMAIIYLFLLFFHCKLTLNCWLCLPFFLFLFGMISFFVNGFCQYTVGAAFKLFCSGMMLAISLMKWQRNPSGLWASPSPLAEGSSLPSGALSLFSAPSHGNTKGNYENTHLGADLRQPYFTPAVTLGVVFPNINQNCCGLMKDYGVVVLQKEKSQQHGERWSLGVNNCFVFAKRCSRGEGSPADIPISLCFGCSQPEPTEIGLEASQWKWLHFQPCSEGGDVWMCVSAGSWGGTLTLLPSSCRAGCHSETLAIAVGQPAPAACSDHGPSQSQRWVTTDKC